MNQHLYQFNLRELQRKCRRPLLSLRSEFPDIKISHPKTKIIPVRSGRRTLKPDIALPVLPKHFLHGKFSCRRFIRQLDIFSPAGQFLMDPSDDPVHLIDKFFPALYNLCPILSQLHIPDIQCIDQIFLINNFFEQGISLIDNTIIVRQITKIDLVKLG